MNLPRITAAICTYDRYNTLAEAIASLARQSLAAKQFEIVVVDNSPDYRRSRQIAKDFREIANLRWAVAKTPGLSNARNVATGWAKAPLIAFMDDDAVADPSWLEQLISAFERFGDVAQVAGGRVDPIWEIPRPAWLPDSLLGYLSVVDWGGHVRVARAGEWLAGTNITFRVDALKSAGGFSTHLGRVRGGQTLLSNDEADVIARVEERGGRQLYVPGAIVAHRVPSERLTQTWFRRRVAWQAVSDYLVDAARFFDQAPQGWRGVMEFYARLPPKDRNPRGLYVHQDDPEMFRMQMSALYDHAIAMLSGYRGIEDTP
jgi:glycosyltransferase involved in cell wall biosynthesis